MWRWESKVKSLSRVRLCDPTDCTLPGFSVHGVFQARMLEWVAISFSRRSSLSQGLNPVSRIVGRCFTIWATSEVDGEANHEAIHMVQKNIKASSPPIFYYLHQQFIPRDNQWWWLFSHQVMSDSATPWTALQDSLSFTLSLSLLKLMSTESVILPTISSTVTPVYQCVLWKDVLNIFSTVLFCFLTFL